MRGRQRGQRGQRRGGEPQPRARPHAHPWSRQDKEAWIKDKYVEKKFLRKPPLAPAREAPRRWRARKCQRHHSSPRAPTARRKGRMEPVLPSVAALCSGSRAAPSAHAWSGWCPGPQAPGPSGRGGAGQEARLGAPSATGSPCPAPAQAPWSVGSAGIPFFARMSWTPSSPISTQGPLRLVRAVSAVAAPSLAGASEQADHCGPQGRPSKEGLGWGGWLAGLRPGAGENRGSSQGQGWGSISGG